MTRTGTKVDVWNRALQYIGENEVLQDPDDDSRLAAVLCNKYWEDALEDVLSEHSWSFARQAAAMNYEVAQWDSSATYAADVYVRTDNGVVWKSLQPANTGNDPTTTFGTWWSYDHAIAPGWQYVYALPDNCVKPLWLLGEGERIAQLQPDSWRPFAIFADSDLEGSVLACDVEFESDPFVLEYVGLHEYVPGWPRWFLEAVAWRLARYLALGLRKDPTVALSLCEEQYEKALAKARQKTHESAVEDQELDTPTLAAR